jgi:DNA-binding MarR family transcriptional regulator
VSRGVGNAQRRAILYLYDRGEEYGVPLGELKRHIGTDRSNARRTLRTLTARNLIEEVREEDGERRVKLTSGAHFSIALTEILEERPPALGDVPSRPMDLDFVFGDPEPVS